MKGDSPMRPAPVLLVIAGVIFITTTARADDVADELKKLEGTWRIVSREHNGQKSVPPDSWQIKGNRITAIVNKNPLASYELKIDPTKKPKTIDRAMMLPESFGSKKLKPGTPNYGIYEVDGDTMKMCYYFYAGEDKDKKRPADFTAPKDSNRLLYILKREKR
jgi:uncharacterized protein (TIGR03067 family)